MRPRSLPLLSVALAVLLVLAGCSALAPADDDPEPSEPSVLRDIAVQNYDNVSHTVDVVVLHNDSVVYWTTREVEGKTHDDTLGTVIDSAVVDPPSVANSTREFTVLVRLDGASEGVRYEVPPETASDCYSLGAEIRDGELLGPVIGHWNDDLYDYCPDP